MKSVLISIQPKWCEKILMIIGKNYANKPLFKKRLELRKSKPNCETPFKAYIYCTKDKYMLWILDKPDRDFHSKIASIFTAKAVGGATKANGKVIGEFICDYILRHCEMANADIAEQQSCVSREDILKYANGKEVFGWHISNLVIYDKPRELNEFRSYNVRAYLDENGYPMPTHEIKRPPQSWCYVESEVDTE